MVATTITMDSDDLLIHMQCEWFTTLSCVRVNKITLIDFQLITVYVSLDPTADSFTNPLYIYEHLSSKITTIEICYCKEDSKIIHLRRHILEPLFTTLHYVARNKKY